MKIFLQTFKLVAATLLAGLLPLNAAAQSAPLRSYSTSGSEHVRSYDPASGWTETFQTFTGRFDIVSTTAAQLTKVYADGRIETKDMILHWIVDLNAPTQGGTAAETPDPTDPVIKRTLYTIGLQSDGLRFTMSGSFTTRAYLSVIPGYYDWFNVAYGNFAGVVVSPLGDYNVAGSEKSGKNIVNYSGVFTLLTDSTAQLTKSYASGSATTVTLSLQTPVDMSASQQTVTATQDQNANGQLTTYILDLQLAGPQYSVAGFYSTIQVKGKSTKTVGSGVFVGQQP